VSSNGIPEFGSSSLVAGKTRKVRGILDVGLSMRLGFIDGYFDDGPRICAGEARFRSKRAIPTGVLIRAPLIWGGTRFDLSIFSVLGCSSEADGTGLPVAADNTESCSCLIDGIATAFSSLPLSTFPSFVRFCFSVLLEAVVAAFSCTLSREHIRLRKLQEF
jgi:hypothetical protein